MPRPTSIPLDEVRKNQQAFAAALEPHLNEEGTGGVQARMLKACSAPFMDAVIAEINRGSEANHVKDGIVAVVVNILGPAAFNFREEKLSPSQMLDLLIGEIQYIAHRKILNTSEFAQVRLNDTDG